MTRIIAIGAHSAAAAMSSEPWPVQTAIGISTIESSGSIPAKPSKRTLPAPRRASAHSIVANITATAPAAMAPRSGAEPASAPAGRPSPTPSSTALSQTPSVTMS